MGDGAGEEVVADYQEEVSIDHTGLVCGDYFGDCGFESGVSFDLELSNLIDDEPGGLEGYGLAEDGLGGLEDLVIEPETADGDMVWVGGRDLERVHGGGCYVEQATFAVYVGGEDSGCVGAVADPFG